MARPRRSRRNDPPDSQLALFAVTGKRVRGPMVRAVTAYLRDEARAGRPVNAFLAGLLRAAAFDRDAAQTRGDVWGSDAAAKSLRSLYSVAASERATALSRESRADDDDGLAAELAGILGGGPTMGDPAQP